MLGENVLQAFLDASGVSAADFNVMIRTFLLAGFFIWAAWCVLSLMHYYKKHPHENISSLLTDYVKVLFLVAVIIALVFAG